MNIAYFIYPSLSEENALNSIKNISLFINTRNRCFQPLRKKIYPILQQCTCLSKTQLSTSFYTALLKVIICKKPSTKIVKFLLNAYGTRRITKKFYYNSELNERLYPNFFKNHLTIVYVPAYNIIILCLTN